MFLPPGQVSGAFPASGVISPVLGCSLMVLELQGNQLTGSLPSQLTDLSQLQVLNVGSNQLTGT